MRNFPNHGWCEGLDQLLIEKGANCIIDLGLYVQLQSFSLGYFCKKH